MSKLPTIIVTLPKAEPQTFELQGERIGLGREADNQIHVASKSVSSSHCEFRKKDGGYELVDLDSTNGTRVNGKPIEAAHTLEDGDRILLGETIPAHFVLLAAGDVAKQAAIAGDESQNAAAAAYTKFDEKLQAIEADIAAKQSEHEEVAAQLKKMHEEFDSKKKEHDELLSSLDKLSTEIQSKKSQSGTSEAEIAKLEDELLARTRRVQVLASDLEGQAEQMQSMQPGAPAPTAPGGAPAPIKIAAMSPPGAAAPPAAAPAPAPAATPPAPKPIAIPAAPAPGAPPVGRGTMKIDGAGEGETGEKKKLLIAEPTKPRPKLKLD